MHKEDQVECHLGGQAVSAPCKSWRASGGGNAGGGARVEGEEGEDEDEEEGGREDWRSSEWTRSHMACSPCRPTLARSSAAFCFVLCCWWRTRNEYDVELPWHEEMIARRPAMHSPPARPAPPHSQAAGGRRPPTPACPGPCEPWPATTAAPRATPPPPPAPAAAPPRRAPGRPRRRRRRPAGRCWVGDPAARPASGPGAAPGGRRPVCMCVCVCVCVFICVCLLSS
jgi:hypothetical protein